MTNTVALRYGISTFEETVSVYEVSSNSIADGVIMEGDIIVSASFRGKTLKITRQYHIIDMILDVRAQDTVTLNIIRNGEEKEITVTVSEDCLAEY